ncbi:MAG: hypothetical protein PHN42_03065 [Bacilli bacterium]|nr:hypothetical protein [Bacilli bacterium]
MNNLQSYLEIIEELKNKVDLFPLELFEGTKKMKENYNKQAILDRNDFVMNLIDKYEINLDIIKNQLNQRLTKLLPENKNNALDIINNKLILLRKVIKYNNKINDVEDKTGFNKIIYNMDNLINTDLREVNNTLLYVINKFNMASIKLTIQDFEYSIYTKKYMQSFLQLMNTDSFDSAMSEKFDEIYWNCPNLLVHLRLNVIDLINKYNKKLVEFVKLKQNNLFKQSQTNVNDYEQTYLFERKNYEQMLLRDPYINVNKFINNQLNINDYLINSSIRKNNISKFINFDVFEKFSEQEKSKFYLDIISLGDSICEVECYRYFEPLIKDIIERYKNKEKNKGLYNLKLKEIKKLEKEKNKQVIKYFKLESKEKNNKLIKISSDINEKIDILNQLYKDLEDSRINEKIYKYINEESTIYDAIKFISSFYGYLKSLIVKEFKINTNQEINEIIDRFYNFAYDTNNVIINKFNLFSKYDIELLIKNKYQLFNINITKEDLVENISSLKETIKYIKEIYYLESDSISLNDIKLICEIKKI